MVSRYTTDTGVVVAEAGMIIDGKYELIEYIGEGGTAKVWRARHVYGDFPCVVKFMNTTRTAFDAAREEFRLLSNLFHPNIVRTYEMGLIPEHDQAYISMELAVGTPLTHFVTRNENLPAADVVVSWLTQMIAVLRYVHHNGVIHKDVKPPNIMVGHDKATMIDFNISTQGTPHMGTLAYKCPCVVQDFEWTRFADVWALAVSFYEALTGRELFQGASSFDIDLSADLPPAGFPGATFSALKRIIGGEGRDTGPDEYQRLFALEAPRPAWVKIPPAVRESFGLTSKNQVFLTLAMMNRPDPRKPTSKNGIVTEALHAAGRPAGAEASFGLRAVFSQLKAKGVVEYFGKGQAKAALTATFVEGLPNREHG